ATHSEARLLDLARKYDAQYILVDRLRTPRSLSFERVYPQSISENPYYVVYRVSGNQDDRRQQPPKKQ
ncbi:MAG: hypothetical protein KY475_24625, partial [Planctomycetes bacterium]|nr:hypothetical protein [Planctomycetota bacterium]